MENKTSLRSDTDLLMAKKYDWIKKMKRLDIILYSTIIGAVLVLLGLFPQSYALDSMGTFFIFYPQAYVLSKDREIFSYLFTQKVKEDTLDLQKEFIRLQRQTEVTSQIPHAEIQTLIDFIEKADTFLFEEDP
jgi:hypothetical protein